MKDFLSRLVQREREPRASILPRLPARFEPVAPARVELHRHVEAPLPASNAAGITTRPRDVMPETVHRGRLDDAADGSLPARPVPEVEERPELPAHTRAPQQPVHNAVSRAPEAPPASTIVQAAAVASAPVEPHSLPAPPAIPAMSREPAATTRDREARAPAHSGDAARPLRIEPAPRVVAAPAVVDAERREREEQRDATSTIQVTIGRIEVRASMEPAPPAPVRLQEPARLTLEEYLRQRRSGER
jgi:hypothetical protein